MAFSANEVKILVTAQDNCSKAVNSITKNLQSLGKIAAVGAAAGIGVAGVALLSFAKSAAEEQVGIARLQTALGNLTEAHKGSAAQVEKVIAARELLAYSDDVLRDSLSMLVAQTGDYEEAVRRQALAMDLARGTGLDLQTASKVLGKVTDETTSVLARYGIVIREGADAQEVLGIVQQKFAGQAVAYSKTAAGAWARFGNQLDNVKETLGAALLPILTKVGTALADFLTKHQVDIERMTKNVAALVEKGFGKVSAWFDENQAMIISAFESMRAGAETAGSAIKDVGNWLLNNKEALILAITGIGLAFAWTNPAGAVLVGLGLVAAAVGVLRTDITKMEPVVGIAMGNMKMAILEFLHTALEAMMVVETFGLSAIPGFGQKVQEFLASKGLSKVAEGLNAIEQEMRDTQAEIDALRFDNAVNQLRNIEHQLNNSAAAARNFQAALAGLIASGVPWSAVMSYQMGTPYVPATGLYQLHRGEAVIPARAAQGMREGRGPAGGNTYNSYTIGPVIIPARDLREMQDVRDFFDRIGRVARAGA